MRVERLPPDIARRITPAALRQHAEALGWQLVPGVNGRIVAYAHLSNPLHQVIVPLNEKFRDYADRVSEAVAGFAEAEGRTVPDVAEQLLFPGCDLLRFRVVNPDGEQESLALDYAVRMLNGLRDLLISAAHIENGSTRGSSLMPEQFVDRCRFGHTLHGHFGFMLACRLDPNADVPDPHPTPFARRVTTGLTDSLRDLSEDEDIEAGHSAPLVGDKYDGRPWLTRDLLTAVASLRPDHSTAVIDLSVVWSDSLRAYPPYPGASKSIRLTRAVFDVARQFALPVSTSRAAMQRMQRTLPTAQKRFTRTAPALETQPSDAPPTSQSPPPPPG